MTKPHLKTVVDSTPKMLRKKHFRQWTQSNECILLTNKIVLKQLEQVQVLFQFFFSEKAVKIEIVIFETLENPNDCGKIK